MLLARVVSALVALGAILLVLFVLPHGFVAPVILAVVAASAWEWGALARLEALYVRIAYAALIVALAAVYAQFGTPEVFRAMLWIAGVWWLVGLVLVLRYPVQVPRWLVLAGGPLTLVTLFVALDGLARFPMDESRLGAALLLFVLFTVWAADVGGYFVGRQFGKRKLAARVSPNKTWAGVIGGLALSGVIGVGGIALFDLAWYRIVPLCVATGAVSVLGDLLISLFKREAGLKDSGSLFPGHGGMLDRVDSISSGATLFVAGIVVGHGPW